jgi:hypothetical protein
MPTPTSIDIRQTQTRILQDQLNAASSVSMDSVLASINNELTTPGRLIAASTPSLVVTVGSGTVVNPNTSKNRVLPFISNVPAGFTGGTITFPSTTGAITVSPGTGANITIGVSQFVAVLVQLNASGQMSLVVGNAAASLGTVVIPSGSSTLLSLGYVIVQSNASSVIQNITNAMLYQFVGGGGGGSGSGSGVGDDLDSLQFRASLTDLFAENDTISTSSINSSGTNASFNAGKNIYTLSYDATKTVTGSGTSMTLSGTPAFTVVAGDMLVVGTEARKIVTVTTQTAYVLESAFVVIPSPSAAAAVVSQAVYTKDIYNLSVDGSAISTGFPGTTFSEILVDYKDTSVSGSNVFVPDVAPVISFTATNDNTNFTLIQKRSTNITDITGSTILPSSGSNLFIRFFGAHELTGSGTVNLIMYKAFMQKAVAQSQGGILWSAYGFSNNLTTSVNCSIATTGGKTVINLTNGNQYAVGVNSTQTYGAVDVYLNGQLLPRFLSGSVPTSGEGYYTETSGSIITLDRDYSSQAWEIQIIQRSQIVDTSTTNTSSISAHNEILQNGFQAFVSQNQLMSATSSVGTPVAGTFYSAVINRASIVDLSQNLKAQMGIERIPIQQIQLLQNEFGPNGESVYSVVNDIFGQIRFVGGTSTQNDGNGTPVSINGDGSTTSYVEITFFGTGLNALVLETANARDFVASVDGGSESATLYPASPSGILSGRNYNTNTVINCVSGLALGVHTVKLRASNASFSARISGVEILNESSSVKVNPGVSYVNGQKLILSSQSVFSYSSVVTGTRGGRVLVYHKSDGTIAQAFQAVNGAQANLTSADHTNEEVVRSYSFREFGSGRTDDFSVSGQLARAFTLDDGTTTLYGTTNTIVQTNSGQPEGIFENGTGGAISFTFVGTGLDVYNPATSATGNTYNVFVDGVQIATSSTLGATKTAYVKIVSGLPYGTHTFKISAATSGLAAFQISKFVVYQPKKPTLPSGAVELADYNVMATFVANTTADFDHIATGTLRKASAREWVYVEGTGGSVNWTVNFGPGNAPAGLSISTDRLNANASITFFGTGFDFRFRGNTGKQNAQFLLNGLNMTTGNFPTASASVTAGTTTFSFSTGILQLGSVASVFDGSLSVTNLPLGIYTLKVNEAVAGSGGNGLDIDCVDIITPIHSVKSNIYADIQNALPVGSCAISDNRKITPVKDLLPITKAWAQAVGISSSPTTTSSSLVPMPDMSVTLKTTGGPLRISWEADLSNSASVDGIQLQVYVDGIATGNLMSVNEPVASSVGAYSSSLKVAVTAGTHKVDLYWLALTGGTVTAISTRRILLVEET